MFSSWKPCFHLEYEIEFLWLFTGSAHYACILAINSIQCITRIKKRGKYHEIYSINQIAG